MSSVSGVKDLGHAGGVTISFGERYLGSDRFQSLYREGMDLVERTARYLDGDGRKDSRGLDAPASLCFATESMRLTTRLMNLASWLLIRRAVNTGEMSLERARKERLKLKLDTIGRPSHVKGYDQLPERLRVLIELSFMLHDKIAKLDRLFDEPVAASPPPQANPVNGQIERLRLVFDADQPT
jgi:regulator of CtrA degradation